MFIGFGVKDAVTVKEIDNVRLMCGTVNGAPECWWVEINGKILDIERVGDKETAVQDFQYLTG